MDTTAKEGVLLYTRGSVLLYRGSILIELLRGGHINHKRGSLAYRGSIDSREHIIY